MKYIGEKNDVAKDEMRIASQLSAEWEECDMRNAAPLWHGGPTRRRSRDRL